MSDPKANTLLRLMPPDDFDRIAGRLEPVPLEFRQVLERPNAPIRHAYFPVSGLASVVSIGARGRRIEAWLFGREGMSGSALLLGDDRAPQETFMQIAGQGHRIAAGDLGDAMEGSAALRAFLLRYVQTQVIQTAQTALANGHARIEERLARWLLMCHDRMDGDDLPLTQEFIALMLGVRRAGVTVALKALERRGLIAVHRGGSALLDRKGLEVLADGSYGVPEAEYGRLIG